MSRSRSDRQRPKDSIRLSHFIDPRAFIPENRRDDRDAMNLREQLDSADPIKAEADALHLARPD